MTIDARTTAEPDRAGNSGGPLGPLAPGTAEAAAAGPGKGMTGLARGGALQLLGAMVSGASGILVVLVASRTTDQTTAGTFYALTSIMLVAAAGARLGSHLGIIYFLARLAAAHRLDRAWRLLWIATVPVGLLSALGGALVFAYADSLAQTFVGNHDSAAVNAVRVMGLLLPFAALLDVLLGASRGLQTQRPTVLVDRVARTALQLVLVVIAAVTVGGAGLLTAAWAVPYVPACIVAVLWFAAVLKRARLNAPPMPELSDPGDRLGVVSARAFWTFTLPRGLASLAQAVIQRFAIVLLAAIRSPAEAAIYTVASRFVVATQLGNQAIATALEPVVAKRMAENDLPGARAAYRAATAWLVLLLWPIALGVLLFPGTVLSVFGQGYRQATTVVMILAFGQLIAVVCGNVDSVLTMAGRTGLNLVTATTSLVVNTALNVLLIPHFGAQGAAIAWACSLTTANVLPLLLLWRVVGLHPFGHEVGRAVVLTLVCAGLLPGVVRLALGDNVLALVIGLVIGLAVFLPAVTRSRSSLNLDLIKVGRPGGSHRGGRPGGGEHRAAAVAETTALGTQMGPQTSSPVDTTGEDPVR